MAESTNAPRLDRLPPNTTIEERAGLEEWIVREAFACTEPHSGSEAYHWTEYRLQERASNATAWLSVEFDDGEWEAVLFERQVRLDEVGYRRGQDFPDEFNLDGKRFVLDESGQLQASKIGSTISYRGRYADYAHGEGEILSIEAFPDPTHTPRETDVEIWLGRVVEPRSLDINVADAGAAQHLVPQALPNAARELGDLGESSRTPQWLKQSLRPVERQYGVMSDTAQRNLRVAAIAGGAAIVLLVLLLIALL